MESDCSIDVRAYLYGKALASSQNEQLMYWHVNCVIKIVNRDKYRIFSLYKVLERQIFPGRAMQNLNQVNHSSGDCVVNQNSTENRYDRFNSKGQEGLSAKFASVLSTLKAQFGQGGSDKGAFKTIDNMMASNKVSLDSFNELKNDKLDEEEERKKSNNKHALENERLQAFNQEAVELQSLVTMEVTNHETPVANKARPSDILAQSLNETKQASVQSTQSARASAANITNNNNADSNNNSSSGSASTNEQLAYGKDELSNGAKAAQSMMQVADSEIGDDLNELNRSNLSTIKSTEQADVTSKQAAKIANYNNNELRQNLDVLARDSNVSKLSLQMTNPQVVAAQKADAKALANLPTSSDPLQGLSAPAQAQNKLLNSLSGSAQIQAGGQVAATKSTGGAIATNNNTNATARIGALNSQSHGAQSLSSRQSIAQMGVRASAMQQSDQVASNSVNTVKGGNAQEALMRLASEQSSSLKMVNAQQALISDEALDPELHQGQLGAAIASLQQGMKLPSHSDTTTNYANSSLYAAMFDHDSSMESATMAFENEDNSDSALGTALGTQQQQVQSKDSAASLTHFAPSGNESHDANELHERVMQMAARNLKQLAVELSPNELGKMKISISLSEDNEAVSVSLAAVNPQTRELLAKALPKLREILAHQHIETEAQVSEMDLDEPTISANAQEQVALSAITRSSAAKRSQIAIAPNIEEVPVESLLAASRTLHAQGETAFAKVDRV